jgi:hypothetical protein
LKARFVPSGDFSAVFRQNRNEAFTIAAGCGGKFLQSEVPARAIGGARLPP